MYACSLLTRMWQEQYLAVWGVLRGGGGGGKGVCKVKKSKKCVRKVKEVKFHKMCNLEKVKILA